ncbi:MAG: hypothetical protein V1827_03725 [Candidatus Micrarchaeota archaeon]
MGMEVDRYAIPEVAEEPIEDIVARMRKCITTECSDLLKRARKGGSNRSRLWESRINRIIEANSGTFSIDTLEGLKKECQTLSEELDRFGERH